MNYSLMTVEGRKSATLFHDGNLYVADDTHPNWLGIEAGLRAADPNVVEQFDVSRAVTRRFEKYSDRVSVANGRVYFDGDAVDNALTQQIIAFLEAGEDFGHLVNFYENIAANPEQHSRDQLFTWLQAAGDFTITEDGHFIAYKGVRKNEKGNGEDVHAYESISRGKAIVDGEVFEGAIPNYVGAVVEMPRSEVVFDPHDHCSTGLHAGSWGYASDFAQGATLSVKINPRDVVSVPNDYGYAKLRTCRYEVLEIVEHAYTAPVWSSSVDNDEDEGYSWGEAEEWDEEGQDELEDWFTYPNDGYTY